MAGDLIKKLRALRPQDLQKFRTEILGVLIIAALTFFFFKVVYNKDVKKMKAADAQITSIKSDMVRLRAEIEASKRLEKELVAAETSLSKTQERLESLKERLPSDRHLSRILDEMTNDGLRGGVRILSIKPAAAEDKGRITRLPFQLKLESGFTSFGDYLERIENLPRAMIVDNFLIEASSGKEYKLDGQLYLSAYILSYGQ